ncbi:hypothetical protein ABI_21290 [Asticcacaulis biprosthecium C19]|uniref:Uncharacterized protein n=1 Tax=Asticcacaulis biprosthecium C19 TaxID=715226 RepID=F4QGK6_9CAUL|nr:hypothetical protein [Asticcacaulis biprosthecium]EGF93687.1 hypothetical protein ABI_21290 [Asticcacaulis biprosthecium C19]
MDDTGFRFGLADAIAVTPFSHSARVNRAVAADPALKGYLLRPRPTRPAEAPLEAGATVYLRFPYEGLGTAIILSVRRGPCGLDYELDLPDPHGAAATWFVPRSGITPT